MSSSHCEIQWFLIYAEKCRSLFSWMTCKEKIGKWPRIFSYSWWLSGVSRTIYPPAPCNLNTAVSGLSWNIHDKVDSFILSFGHLSGGEEISVDNVWWCNGYHLVGVASLVPPPPPPPPPAVHLGKYLALTGSCGPALARLFCAHYCSQIWPYIYIITTTPHHTTPHHTTNSKQSNKGLIRWEDWAAEMHWVEWL